MCYDVRQVAVYRIEVDYLHPCFDFLCNSMVECDFSHLDLFELDCSLSCFQGKEVGSLARSIGYEFLCYRRVF